MVGHGYGFGAVTGVMYQNILVLNKFPWGLLGAWSPAPSRPPSAPLATGSAIDQLLDSISFIHISFNRTNNLLCTIEKRSSDPHNDGPSGRRCSSSAALPLGRSAAPWRDSSGPG
eukprot:6213814-Pleurochrysis_carterae.AAC.1